MENNNQTLEYKDQIRGLSTIYKFVDTISALKILENSSLVFNNPANFNDPFDCYSELISFNRISPNKMSELKEKYLDRFPESFKEIENALKLNELNELENLFRNYAYPRTLSKIGISCFSKKFNSALMWSHYSKSHSGLCIGFDLKKLYFSLENIEETSKALIPVHYTNEFKTKDFFEDNNQAIKSWMQTKSENWSYEDEVRIVYYNLPDSKDSKRIISFNKIAINEIIFGATFKEELNLELIKILNLNFESTKISKMYLKKDKFELEKKVYK